MDDFDALKACPPGACIPGNPYPVWDPYAGQYPWRNASPVFNPTNPPLAPFDPDKIPWIAYVQALEAQKAALDPLLIASQAAASPGGQIAGSAAQGALGGAASKAAGGSNKKTSASSPQLQAQRRTVAQKMPAQQVSQQPTFKPDDSMATRVLMSLPSSQ